MIDEPLFIFGESNLVISVSDPITAFAGPDTVVCINDLPLQLENYSPLIGINWYGETSEQQASILDQSIGLIDPQLLSSGEHNFIIEFGSSSCYSLDTITVTVDPLPVLTLGLSLIHI